MSRERDRERETERERERETERERELNNFLLFFETNERNVKNFLNK